MTGVLWCPAHLAYLGLIDDASPPAWFCQEEGEHSHSPMDPTAWARVTADDSTYQASVNHRRAYNCFMHFVILKETPK